MTDKQIKEVMRLADVIEDLAWSAGKTEQYHDEPTDYAEKLPAARAALEAYLRTLGEPESVNAELLDANLCQIVGIKADGSKTVLGSGVMPPAMKARELLHNYGFDPSDDNGEGGYAMAAVEELIDWMKKVGWKAPALISVKQEADEAGCA